MAVIDLGEEKGPFKPGDPFYGGAIIFGQKPPSSSKKPSTPINEQPQDQQPSLVPKTSQVELTKPSVVETPKDQNMDCAKAEAAELLQSQKNSKRLLMQIKA